MVGTLWASAVLCALLLVACVSDPRDSSRSVDSTSEELSPIVERAFQHSFKPDERVEARKLVLQALASFDRWAVPNDRCLAALLKVADGDLGRLAAATRVAKRDWRDILCEAGFEHDIKKHEAWLKAFLADERPQ